MTDFATTSDVVSALAAANTTGGGGNFNIYKASITAVAGFWYSGWTEGGAPAGGVAPTTWATCTKSLLGAYNAQFVNPTPMTARLLWGSIAQANAGQTKWVIDRLGHMGGLSGTVTTAQSTGATGNTGSWVTDGRCSSDYDQVEWYLEWYSATGSTGVNATCAITYNDGTTGTAQVIAVPASCPAFRMYPIQVPAGTSGKWIKSVDSVTLSATTGTAGNFGVTALVRLAAFSSPVANYSTTLDYAGLGMPLVGNNACLNAIYWTTTTSTGITLGTLTIGAH